MRKLNGKAVSIEYEVVEGNKNVKKTIGNAFLANCNCGGEARIINDHKKGFYVVCSFCGRKTLNTHQYALYAIKEWQG